MNEEEVNKIIEVYDEVIADLKQENQQLTKERNAMACLVNDLQETLEEIREYIEQNKVEKEYTDRGGFRVHTGTYFVESADDLLQIIDKSMEEK